MAYVPGTSAIDISAWNNVSSNNPLSGPVQVDTSYQFGDWITGRSAAKQQAAAQAQLDYAEYVRNQNSAAQQRLWEEMMDNTKVQRAMKDYQAAGLNPWLALQSGGLGSNVPSGASASSSAGQVASSGNPMTGLASAAVGIAALVKVIAKLAK